MSKKLKSNLVHVQADSELVLKLKVVAAARNKNMYDVLNEAISRYFEGLNAEMDEIASFLKATDKLVEG